MVRIVKTEEEFNDIIKNKKVVVDFYATWCGPCRMMVPLFEEVSDEKSDILFVKVNIDEVESLPRRFNVMSIPTIFVFEDGALVKQKTGYMEKDELLDFIK